MKLHYGPGMLFMAQRNPRVWLRFLGSLLRRCAARRSGASDSHPDPRITLRVPSDGPCGLRVGPFS